jgi:hypothetical protein
VATKTSEENTVSICSATPILNQEFEGKYCLHLQGNSYPEPRLRRKILTSSAGQLLSWRWMDKFLLHIDNHLPDHTI